jgi:hypothetical protein
MKVIKRTSPGPKIGPTGSSIGAPKGVGTTGADKTSISTTGGQFDFLPTPSPKEGEIRGTKPGQKANTKTENYYDFMPRKAGEKK